jgi:hypothetical protein
VFYPVHAASPLKVVIGGSGLVGVSQTANGLQLGQAILWIAGQHPLMP